MSILVFVFSCLSFFALLGGCATEHSTRYIRVRAMMMKSARGPGYLLVSRLDLVSPLGSFHGHGCGPSHADLP